jgi:hypothetical protein
MQADIMKNFRKSKIFPLTEGNIPPEITRKKIKKPGQFDRVHELVNKK